LVYNELLVACVVILYGELVATLETVGRFTAAQAVAVYRLA